MSSVVGVLGKTNVKLATRGRILLSIVCWWVLVDGWVEIMEKAKVGIK